MSTLLSFSSEESAYAQETSSLWQDIWHRFDGGDIAWMGGAALTYGLANVLMPRQPRFRWENKLGGGIRRALRFRKKTWRKGARSLSDVTLTFSVLNPLLIDGLGNAWLGRNDRIAAQEMMLTSLEVSSVTLALHALTNLAARERPYADRCGSKEGADGDCDKNTRWRSFVSGHSAFAFSVAATSCVFRIKIPGLSGDPGAAIACSVSYTFAALTALSRVLGDMHFATDVLLGSMFGALVGTFLPLLKMQGPSREAFPSGTTSSCGWNEEWTKSSACNFGTKGGSSRRGSFVLRSGC